MNRTPTERLAEKLVLCKAGEMKQYSAGLRERLLGAIDTVSTTDARSFYAHCGFPLPAD